MIGRSEEVKLLKNAYESEYSEFVTVYGRRRIGKTIGLGAGGVRDAGAVRGQFSGFERKLPIKSSKVVSIHLEECKHEFDFRDSAGPGRQRVATHHGIP